MLGGIMKKKEQARLDETYDGVFATIGHNDNNTGCRFIRRIKNKYYVEDWNAMTREEQVSFLMDLQGMFELFSRFTKEK